MGPTRANVHLLLRPDAAARRCLSRDGWAAWGNMGPRRSRYPHLFRYRGRAGARLQMKPEHQRCVPNASSQAPSGAPYDTGHHRFRTLWAGASRRLGDGRTRGCAIPSNWLAHTVLQHPVAKVTPSGHTTAVARVLNTRCNFIGPSISRRLERSVSFRRLQGILVRNCRRQCSQHAHRDNDQRTQQLLSCDVAP